MTAYVNGQDPSILVDFAAFAFGVATAFLLAGAVAALVRRHNLRRRGQVQ